MKVIIIGGVAGGASAAARLRRLDERAEIIMLEKGAFISFANCGLPYYIGGEITDAHDLFLQSPESFNERFRVDVRVHSEAIAIDREKQEVTILNHVTGEEYRESYDKLVLSPGAKPIVPSIPGIENPRVFTLRDVTDTLKIHAYIDRETAQTAVILGGGFIGLEMAEALTNRGLSVTLVTHANQVLPPLDPEMAADLHIHLRGKGVRLLLNNEVSEIDPLADKLQVQLRSGEQLHADLLMLSIGVRPDSELAVAAGLAVNNRGAILTDDHLQTNDPDIYAIGDAIAVTNTISGQPDYIPLAGPANKQGRMVADILCGYEKSYRGTQGSSVIKLFDMTAASTGLSEKKLRTLGRHYDKVYLYSSSHASYYPDAKSFSMKVLFDTENGRILGAQLVGYDGVDKRCDVLATAIRAGLTAYDLTELELCYAPPYSSAKDPINMAGFVIENILTHKVRQAHWEQLPSILANENAILLDVRTPDEVNRGRIDGSVAIPLDNLRERLHELDRRKTIYVHCQSGLRSYLACRILSQNTYDCLNISGGYRLYSVVRQSNI